MLPRVHYQICPACGHPELTAVAEIRDFSVSGEIFSLVECGACRLRITQDVPGREAIGAYYQSDDYISHTNRSAGLIGRLYRLVRKRTLAQKRRLIESRTSLQRGRLLDVGSGTGAFVQEMKGAGWEVTGLEPDEGARRVAAEVHQARLQPLEDFFALPVSGFDAITLWHVLEHVHDLEAYMAQLKKLLREKGRLFIAVPNYTSADAGLFGEFWAAWDVPRHLYHFSPASIEALVKKSGLILLEKRPMWFDSYYVSLLSTRYRSGHTRYMQALLAGFRSNRAARKNPERCSSLIYVIGK